MGCCEIDRPFLRTVPFYLKVAELTLCIPIWICVGSVSGFPQFGGGGFINFCSTITFVGTLFLFLLYLFAKIQVLPGPWILIEVIIILSSVVLFLLAMIIAAIYNNWGSAVIAAAVFCGIAMVIYLVEFFFRFKVMRSEGFQFSAHMRSTETVTTTNSAPNEAHNKSTAGPYIIGA